MSVSVSVVIVHYRGRRELRQCVETLLRDAPPEEILIADNDGTRGELHGAFADPRIRVLTMPRNLGYGGAANVAMDRARGESILVLNQDVEIDSTAIDELLRVADVSGAWVVAPKLFGRDDSEAAEKQRFPHPLEWTPRAASHPSYAPVPWCAGAAMLFAPGHTDLRFDPRLFLFAEDEELCWRIWAAGGSVAMARDAHAVHEGGTSTRTKWSTGAIAMRTQFNRCRIVAWHDGLGGVLRFAWSVARERIARGSADEGP